MPRFSANLNFLFNEVQFLDRFEAAAKAGFKQVEFMFPYEYEPGVILKKLKEYGLKLVLFNLPAGNWGKGDRGIAADPSRKEEFLSGVKEAIKYAHELNVTQMDCLVGIAPENLPEKEIKETLTRNIQAAADALFKEGFDLLVEPINHFDMPGFYLNKTSQVMDIIKKLGMSNLKLQYDIYHAEREGENHIDIISNYAALIGHVQIADNPGRHEPGTGNIRLNDLINYLDRSVYFGYIGLEYKPSTSTPDSFGWLTKYGYSL